MTDEPKKVFRSRRTTRPRSGLGKAFDFAHVELRRAADRFRHNGASIGSDFTLEAFKIDNSQGDAQ